MPYFGCRIESQPGDAENPMYAGGEVEKSYLYYKVPTDIYEEPYYNEAQSSPADQQLPPHGTSNDCVYEEMEIL